MFSVLWGENVLALLLPFMLISFALCKWDIYIPYIRYVYCLPSAECNGKRYLMHGARRKFVWNVVGRPRSSTWVCQTSGWESLKCDDIIQLIWAVTVTVKSHLLHFLSPPGNVSKNAPIHFSLVPSVDCAVPVCACRWLWMATSHIWRSLSVILTIDCVREATVASSFSPACIFIFCRELRLIVGCYVNNTSLQIFISEKYQLVLLLVSIDHLCTKNNKNNFLVPFLR